MTLHEWLNGETGRAARMAEHFGVTRAAISQWRSKGAPVAYIRQISELTGGAVAVDELLSDIEQRRAEA